MANSHPWTQVIQLTSLSMQRLWICVIGGIFLGQWAHADDTKVRREQFFESQVRPLLFNRCFECHGDKKQESGLRLDSRAAIVRGGDSGPAVVVRNGDDSLLIQAVRGEIEQMPPDDPLDEAEIEILERWVAMGLPWAAGDVLPEPSLGDQVAIKELAASHWAFQPIRKPQPPASDGAGESAIDAFINKQLVDAGVSPSAPADRRTLLRRLSFDLVGLPPTAAEVAAFESDTDADAVEKVVERLLQSPHYGERWARHWLDVARYADSRDWQAQADLRYPFAYTYRDWVIQALNDDMPYDEFICKQLAADFIEAEPNSPQLAALGFLTVGPRFRNDRLELIADQIDVVTRGLMGLTVACARCHDHKYDPVPIEDYYSLYGVFASCSLPDEFPELATAPGDEQQANDFRIRLAEAEQAMATYRDQLRREAITDLKKRVGLYLSGYYEMGLTRSTEIRGAISKLGVKETAMTPLNDRLIDLLRKGNPDDPVMGPWVTGLRLDEIAYAAKAGNLLLRWTSAQSGVNALVKAKLKASAPKTRKALIQSYAEVFEAVLASNAADTVTQAVRDRLLGDNGVFDLDTDRVVAASRLMGAGRKRLGDLEKGIGEVFSTHPGAPPRAMVVKDLETPVTPYVMLRGEPARRGDKVDRRFISLLSATKPKKFRQGSGRLELAEQIVAEANPLTARVMVNRVWAQYFGKGLVENVDDFGLRCPPPQHLELLDWLAASLRDHQWSLKWLQREIVMSNAYQRSCDSSPTAVASDPENGLLSSQNRRRLDVEAMRDAILATSDLLDPRIGGRPVPLSAIPFTHRRTVYAYIDRVDLDELLKTFDMASPMASASERSSTMIPQQALFLMNHPMLAEYARQMAGMARAGKSDESAVVEMYGRLFQRRPSEDELSLALQFVSQTPTSTTDAVGVWSYGYGSTDRTRGDFTPFQHWTGQAYQPSESFPDPVFRAVKLFAEGGNAMARPEQAVIRRWTSPGNGRVRIEGTVEHTRDTGDGLVAQIISPTGRPIFEKQLFNEAADGSVDSVEVAPGQTIEFLVHCFKNPSADSFRWAPTLVGMSGDLRGETWDAGSDFAGPPPPKLNSWEQLAQALMLTNEFHFLD